MDLLWTRAQTFADFGECMALSLEGRLLSMPTQAPPNAVTPGSDRLHSLIARLDRSGRLVVTHWQPACTRQSRPYGGIVATQRAGVMGFVPPDAIAHFRDMANSLGAEVDVQIGLPGGPAREANRLVSRNAQDQGVLWFGYVLSGADIARNYGGVLGDSRRPGLSWSVIAALQGCYQVSVVDTQWGRNSLWGALAPLLG